MKWEKEIFIPSDEYGVLAASVVVW